jgi:hypothetical protein
MSSPFGKTGDFPRGKLSQHDEGALNMGIAVHDRTVIINFGTPVKSMGLDKATALQLADLIRKKAEEIPG